ncbi:MAG: hypothetical protein LH473_07200 [Chitinophagales bacterium]|nr:hypothetical protein [Chitinophagales bacterium]
MKFSNNYEKIFTETYKEFLTKPKISEYLKKGRKYVLVFPQIGTLFQRGKGILVVGRAPNNWHVQFNKINFEGKANESILYSRDNETYSNLKWVYNNYNGIVKEEYNLKKSKFWRSLDKIVHRSILNVEEPDPNWMSHIAWSNLYKIAPAVKNSGNPNEQEVIAQFEGSVKMFKMEIEELQPKIILMMTDYSTWGKWVLNELENVKLEKGTKYVEKRGYYKSSKIIVTGRPDSRKKGSSYKKLCDEVISFI